VELKNVVSQKTRPLLHFQTVHHVNLVQCQQFMVHKINTSSLQLDSQPKSVACCCNYFYRQACLCVAQPCRYCFYSVVQKWVFRPAGATCCPDKPRYVKVGMGERTAGPLPRARSPVPTFTFIGAKLWEYSPQNCQNFEFWPEICTSGATPLQYFYEILSVCTRL